MATAKKTPPKAAKKDEKAELIERISRALDLPAAEVELRALRELAANAGVEEKKKPAPKAPPPREEEEMSTEHPALPKRLYLLLDGRGLDGRGMPIEVIDLPCIIGSSRKASVWINSPQIETRHVQITHGDKGWILEDLGSEHGTFLGDQPVKKRVIRSGDEYRLAGYLRLKTELH
jgi:hypothetical protein